MDEYLLIVCRAPRTVNSRGHFTISRFGSWIHLLSAELRKRAMIRNVLELVRPVFVGKIREKFGEKKTRFFVWAGLTALGLRLFLVVYFPGVVDDSRFYANIAENWLQHGIYGITNSGVIVPTLSRLPGYPAFLAAIFALFGDDNFREVLLIQALSDVATCFLTRDLAR